MLLFHPSSPVTFTAQEPFCSSRQEEATQGLGFRNLDRYSPRNVGIWTNLRNRTNLGRLASWDTGHRRLDPRHPASGVLPRAGVYAGPHGDASQVLQTDSGPHGTVSWCWIFQMTQFPPQKSTDVGRSKASLYYILSIFEHKN